MPAAPTRDALPRLRTSRLVESSFGVENELPARLPRQPSEARGWPSSFATLGTLTTRPRSGELAVISDHPIGWAILDYARMGHSL